MASVWGMIIHHDDPRCYGVIYSFPVMDVATLKIFTILPANQQFQIKFIDV
jgi:hypothetical protein